MKAARMRTRPPRRWQAPPASPDPILADALGQGPEPALGVLNVRWQAVGLAVRRCDYGDDFDLFARFAAARALLHVGPAGNRVPN